MANRSYTTLEIVDNVFKSMGLAESHDRGSHHHSSHHHGSHHHNSHRHGSHRHRSHHHRTHRDEEEDQPANQITHHHHYIFKDPNKNEIERAHYHEDRGDYYKAAYKQERQRANKYHADRDAFDVLYHEERHRRHSENREARHAQRDHYLQGYEDGWDNSQEVGGRAVRKQTRQHEKARREDYRRYDQGVNEAYEYGRRTGQQRQKSKKKTARPASPNNHSHRVTYQDSRGNDAAYQHPGQWHGYAETEYDD